MPNFMFQFVPERQIMQTVKQDRFEHATILCVFVVYFNIHEFVVWFDFVVGWQQKSRKNIKPLKNFIENC